MEQNDLGDVLKLPYSVDFDGVLAKSVWPDRGIGEPIPENLDKLREVVEAGHDVVIHTARPWSDQKRLEAWCELHEVPYKAIICGKFLAERYVDDKGINSQESSWL